MACRRAGGRVHHVEAGGHHFAYRAWGEPDAPPIVLVHGYVVSSVYMAPLARVLAGRWRALAPDLPGFGRSSKPRDALDVDGLADALAAWIRAVGVAQAPVVGNSMGCQVAVALAQRHPGLASHLVLIGPTVGPRARSVPRQAWRLAKDSFRERSSLPWIHLPDWFRCGPRRMAQSARHALADAIESRAPEVQVPVLVLRGQRDPLVSHRFAAELAAAFPRATLMVVPGSPHAGNYSAPRRTAAMMEAFLIPPGPRGSTPSAPRPSPARARHGALP